MRVAAGRRLHTATAWALSAGCTVSAGVAAAESSAPPLPAIGSFFRNAEVADVRLSPSGAWLALSVGQGTTRRGLAVVDVDGKQPPTVIAAFSDADVRSFRWVTDDRLIFNLIDDQSGGGEQSFGPGMYSVHRDGSEMRQLIKTRREFVRRTELTRRETLEWNHDLLDVPRDGTHEVIIGKLVYDQAHDLQAVNAMRLDVDTGRTRSLAADSPPNARQWRFDPKGEPRLVVARHEGVVKTYWRAPGQNAWALIASDPILERSFWPYFVDGSGHLFVLVAEGSARTDVLKRFDFASGKPERETVVATPGFDLRAAFMLNSDSTVLTGLRLVTDAQTMVWFDPTLKAIQKTVDARLPGHVNVLNPCSLCDDGKIVLVHSWSDQDPGTWWLYRSLADSWQVVGKARSEIDPAAMATLDLHRIKARDGEDLPVWVTTPAKTGAQKRGAGAAVVLVHGGPWMRGTHWEWSAEAQFLASRGYVVIEPEFRGSTGFGDAHFRAGWKQWGGTMQDDVADAVRWAADKGVVDPKRVCIAGASYGGYAALMGTVRYPDLYRCGVAWIAVTDPRLMFDPSWQSDISEEGRRFDLPALLGDPVKDAELLRSAAPLEHAAEIRTPLLLAFGSEDARVPLKHGTLMRDALRGQGRDPQWVVYVGEGHGWLKVDNRVDFWSRVERFLDKNLNGAPAAR